MKIIKVLDLCFRKIKEFKMIYLYLKKIETGLKKVK